MTAQIVESTQDNALADEFHLGERAVREAQTDLETMELIETWIESRGRGGQQIETAFKPQWVREAVRLYAFQNEESSQAALRAE